jgi:DNA-binding NarL/FixJ family response regulator
MECRIALGGNQAIRFGTAWLPDVKIMDISMPEVNGFEATFALRRDLRTGNTLIIASPHWMKPTWSGIDRMEGERLPPQTDRYA